MSTTLFYSCVSSDERLNKVRTFGIDQLWAVLYAEGIQESVKKAARSRLNRLIKEARCLSITFEDHGQDFLTWTLDKHGKVIDSNAQAWAWVGGHVTDYRTLMPGVPPLYCAKDGVTRRLNYPLTSVKRFAGAKT